MRNPYPIVLMVDGQTTVFTLTCNHPDDRFSLQPAATLNNGHFSEIYGVVGASLDGKTLKVAAPSPWLDLAFVTDQPYMDVTLTVAHPGKGTLAAYSSVDNALGILDDRRFLLALTAPAADDLRRDRPDRPVRTLPEKPPLPG